MDISRMSEGIPVAEIRSALLSQSYRDAQGADRPSYTDVELAAMTEDELRRAYFTEFYVDESGWA